MLRVATGIAQASRIFVKNDSQVFLLKNAIRTCCCCDSGYVLPVNKKYLKNPSIYETTERTYRKFNTSTRFFSSETELDSGKFEQLSAETLESLMEHFEEVIEDARHLKNADVSYGDGVLTVQFGHNYGTYVINRQLPNRQIWLSSPKSGPKRYDYINGKWIYKHDGISLHELLMTEIPDIVQHSVAFDKCLYSGCDESSQENKT